MQLRGDLGTVTEGYWHASGGGVVGCGVPIYSAPPPAHLGFFCMCILISNISPHNSRFSVDILSYPYAMEWKACIFSIKTKNNIR